MAADTSRFQTADTSLDVLPLGELLKRSHGATIALIRCLARIRQSS
jgi:hypothetical protein